MLAARLALFFWLSSLTLMLLAALIAQPRRSAQLTAQQLHHIGAAAFARARLEAPLPGGDYDEADIIDCSSAPDDEIDDLILNS